MTGHESTPKREDLIFDVGMHRGEDTAFYLKKGFHVVGFEANPNLARDCRERFAEAVEQNRLVVIEGAIAPPEAVGADGRVRFFRNSKSVWGTVSVEWAERNERLGTSNEVIDVAYVDFAKCLRRYGVPYYLKIDIEGADHLCLETLFDFKARPSYVSLESEKTSFEALRAEVDLLERLGYHDFKAVQQATVKWQEPLSPAREGVYAAHRFEGGASGMFGEESPGRWVGREALLRRYRAVFLCYRLLGDESLLRRGRPGRKLMNLLSRIARRPVPGWYDTHARHASADRSGR